MIFRLSLIVLILIGSFHRIIDGFPTSKSDAFKRRKPYENPDLVEGDMLFPPTSRGVARRGEDIPWPNGIVPYEISPSFGLTQQLFIIATMQKMERIIAVDNHQCIHFRPRNASDRYFITIINGNGCYSYVGQNTGIEMVREVSLQHPGCVYEAIIMHELLHTLGFHHEQTRPDRDSYVRVNYENIVSGYENNFYKYNDSIVDTLNTSYDYSSVMHYETDAFSKNGLPTIEPLDENATIGQRENMSAIDIEEVRIFYNCTASGQTFGPIPTTTTVNLYQYNTTVSSQLTSQNPQYIRPGTSRYFYYDQYLITVNTNGYYIIRSWGSLDTVGFIYTDSFSPTSPRTNMLAADDDSGDDGQFKFEIYLNSNAVYILVATTYRWEFTGSYSLAASGFDPINITKIAVSTDLLSNYSSSLTNSSPTYVRPSAYNYVCYYEAIQLNVTVSGNYSLRSVSSIDSIGYLYIYYFDSLNPIENLIELNDESGGNNQFLITYWLQANERYILLFTPFHPDVTTPFSIIASGPGRVHFSLFDPTITTPSTTTTTPLTTSEPTTTPLTASEPTTTPLTISEPTTTPLTTSEPTTTTERPTGTSNLSMKINILVFVACFILQII